MYKVMIVEDEMLVRVGIRNIINCKQLNIELTEDAKNGVEAYSIYEREKPNIILTDILMPEMGGLELIKKIRETDLDCRFIILSCVQDFDIAQKAIEYNVSGYILKLTMSIAEIETLLLKAIDELNSISVPLKKVSAEDKNAVKEHFLKNLLFYNRYPKDRLKDYMAEYDIKINSANLIVGIASLISYQKVKERYSDPQGGLVVVSILNILQELLNNYFSGEIFHDQDSNYIMIINLDNSNEYENNKKLTDFTNRLSEIIKMYFDSQIILSLSKPVPDVFSLSSGYNEAYEIYNQYFYLDKSMGYEKNQDDLLEVVKREMEKLKTNPILTKLFDETDKCKYFDRIETLLEKLPTPNDLKVFFVTQAQFVTYYSENRTNIDYADEINNHVKHIQTINNLSGLIVHHLKYLNKLLNDICNINSYSSYIKNTIEYINEHLSENISLNVLADYVHLTPNYLSNLFKKEVGENFVDYINKQRIVLAKQLLLSSQKRSVDISDELGFSDVAYFCKIFKKYTNFSPVEYRKKHTK